MSSWATRKSTVRASLIDTCRPASYLSQPVPPFTWNIAEMRKAPLLESRRITAKKTGGPLSLESAEWKTVPAETLGPLSLGSPAPQWGTEVKAAYDPTALYVRLEGQLPPGWAPPPPMQRDRKEISCAGNLPLVVQSGNVVSR